MPGLADICRPLDKLRQGSFQWGEPENEAFQRLKKSLINMVSLHYPDENLQLHVECDASDVGVGAALYQMVNRVPRYLSFASRSLKAAERNYPATRKELTSVLFALRKFHDYISGRKFKLHTDHEPLTYWKTKDNLSKVLQNQLKKYSNMNMNRYMSRALST